MEGVNLYTVLTLVVSSAAGAAIVQAVKEIIIWKLNRKAKVEDDKKNDKLKDIADTLKLHGELLEGLAESIEGIRAKVQLTMDNDRLLLKDKIKYLIHYYLERGEISLENKQYIHHMWNAYHYDLGGNGDLDDEMAMLDELHVIR